MTPAAAALQTHAPAPPMPAQPRTLAETGIAVDHVEQLLVKTLFGSELTGHAIADRMRMTYAIIEPLIERARAEQLIEVKGMTGTGSASFRYALTDLGRDRARQFMEINQYVGPLPVPLASYVDYMRALTDSRGFIDHDRLRRGFSHLVVSDHLLEQLGPALNSGKGLFLYGPPGNGKTVLGEGLGRALGGEMWIPHAVDIEGNVITMFDPLNHESLEADADAVTVVASATRDRRWVKIRRPVVVVGGELTLEQLDLTFNPLSKFYEAPIHLKANGGVFLVDDFGRQRMRPQDLLNRWIVPLESRVDYLTLHTGKKFQVPFDVLTVFATNLDPRSLADEAFLRRIPYKIPVPDPTVEQFTRIFEMYCTRRQLYFDTRFIGYLQQRHYGPTKRHLRACHPRDLIEQVMALCRYRGTPVVITEELLDRACESYFVDEDEAASVQ
jgi:DNA-binding PadR family transcriptional regulator